MHTYYLIFLGLFFVFTFALGVFTLIHNPKSRVHQLWFLVNLGGAIWSGGLFAVVLLNTLTPIYHKILHVGSTLIVVFLFHFILVFLFKNTQKNKLIIINYFIGLIFILFIIFTSWVVKGAAAKSTFSAWVDPGFLYLLYVLYFLIVVIVSYFFLYQGYKENEGFRKKQILIIFWATLIGLGGGMTNFLPQLLNVYPFGTFIIFLYPLLITYGIFLKKY